MKFNDSYQKDNESIIPTEEKKKEILEKIKEAERNDKLSPDFKSGFSLKMKIISAAAAFCLIVTGVFVGLKLKPDNSGNGFIYKPDDPVHTASSYKEVYKYISDAVDEKPGLLDRIIEIEESAMDMDSRVTQSAVSDKTGDNADVNAGSFSGTNIQVEGVDEADIIKNDGKYLYYLTSDEDEYFCSNYYLNIISEEGESSKLVSRYDFKSDEESGFYPREMYLSGESLFVIAEHTFNISAGGGFFSGRYSYSDYETEILTFDVSDRAAPELVSTYCQDGSYSSSRMTDGIIYLFTNDSVYDGIDDDDPSTFVPSCGDKDGKALIPENSICICPKLDSVSYAVIGSFDTAKSECISSFAALGFADVSYVNDSHIIMTCPEYSSDEKELDGNKYISLYEYKRTTDISLFDIEDGKITFNKECTLEGFLIGQFAIDEYNGNFRIAATVDSSTYYDASTEYNKKYGWLEYNLVEDDLVTYGSQVSTDSETESTTTASSAPSIGNTDPDPSENMWERISNLNSSITDKQRVNCGRVYILDESLEMVSVVDNLGETEEIKSVRFDGDVGYVVTFRQTDPLFAIDLSDPTAPKVLDALKIEGFSQYLHPYGDGLLLGLGYDADEYGSIKGLKMVMFDTSDKTDVTAENTTFLDNRFYNADALTDHNALLISPDRNLIGFAVYAWNNYDDKADCVYKVYSYGENGFNELISCDLSSNFGFTRGAFSGDYIYICNDKDVNVYSLTSLNSVKTFALN